MELGQQDWGDSRVAHMDIVGSSTSGHECQAQLNQAASSGGLLVHKLEEME